MTFPNTPLSIGVELYYDAGAGPAWQDITADVIQMEPIKVSHGRAREGSRVEPSRLSLTLNNAAGKYSNRNPASPLFGKIGRNTPIRLWVELGQVVGTNRHYLFTGEVPEWPQRWTSAGKAYVPLEAAGILRRLGQGASPVQSVLRRYCALLPNLVGYWPMEDKPRAGVYAAVVGTVMRVSGSASPGQSEAFIASDSLPEIHQGQMSARPIPHAVTGQTQVRWLMQAPPGAVPDGAILLRARMNGSLAWVDVLYRTGGGIEVLAYNSAGVYAGGSGVFAYAVDGKLLRCSLEIEQVGANVQVRFATLEQGAISGGTNVFALANIALGTVAQIEIAPKPTLWDLGETVIGHVTVQNTMTSLFDLAGQLRAFDGERANTRIARLAAENGLGTVVDDPAWPADDSALMGPQDRGTLLDLLGDAVAAGQGILSEYRGSPASVGGALRLRPLSSIYTTAADCTITYTDNLLRPFEPVEDDAAVRNAVTVTRAGGSSATVEDVSGPLGTSRIGIYDESVTLSLASDAQVPDQAGWRLHLGTVDEARWPVIGLDLADAPFLSDPALTRAVLLLDLGDRLDVTNLPPWLPPDPVQAIVQGVSYELRPESFRVEFNATPASPYRVGRYGATGARYVGAASDIRSAITSTTATSIQVRKVGGGLVPWTEAAGDMPFDIMIGGERMRVTAVSTVGSTHQLFTVTRSINGVAKTHPVNTPVTLADPVYFGL